MVFAFLNLGAQEMIVLLLLGVLVVWPYWRIFSKAGFSGWLAIGMLIRVANLILLFYLAFAEWPALRRTGSWPGSPPGSEGQS